jgi:basic membrane protein A
LASQADQTSLAPEIVVASAIYEWRPLLRTLVKEIKGGTRGEKVFTLDYSNDSIRMIINGSVLEKALRGKAEKGTEKALLGKTEKDMKEGKIKINIE